MVLFHIDSDALVCVKMVASGELLPGHAFDDGALKACVSSRPNAKGYYVARAGDAAEEHALDTRFLG